MVGEVGCPKCIEQVPPRTLGLPSLSVPEGQHDRTNRGNNTMHRPFMKKLAMMGWLLVGAFYGWAVAVLLWQARWIEPYDDYPRMLLVVLGCMVLFSAYGVRKHREVLPRLIAYLLLFGGLAWLMRPLMDCSSRTYWLLHQAYFVYPRFIIPAGVVGGIIAIVFARLRQKGETANPVSSDPSQIAPMRFGSPSTRH